MRSSSLSIIGAALLGGAVPAAFLSSRLFLTGDSREADPRRILAMAPARPAASPVAVDGDAGESASPAMSPGAAAIIRLEVRLRDWTGEAVPGAAVTCELEIKNAENTREGAAAGCGFEAEDTGGGTYLFALPARARALITARAAGFASEASRWDPGDEEMLEMVLQPPARIGGVVRALDGTPIAGARLTGSGQSAHWVEEFIDDATTDAEGRFLFPALRPNYFLDYTLEVRAEGAIGRWVRAGLGDEEVEVVLLPAAVITGRVVDRASGRPVPGVEVFAPHGSILEPFHDGAETDGDGRFELGEVSPGAVDLTLWRGAVQSLEIPGIEVPLAGRIDLGTIPFDTVEGALVQGRVLLASDRTPLPGVRVSASRAPEDPETLETLRASTTTSTDGRFVLENLLPGLWDLEARPDFGPTLARAQLRVGAGPAEAIEILIRLEDSIAGRVLEADGTPAAGALVYLGYTGEAPTSEQNDAIPHLNAGACALCWGLPVDADGGFRLRGLPPYPRYALLAVLDSRRFAAVEGLAVEGTRPLENLEIRLPPGVALRGRVVDSNGRGLPRVEAIATWLAEPIGGIRLWRDQDYEKDSILRASAETDSDGRFVLEGVQPGNYFLYADTPGRIPPEPVKVLAAPGARAPEVVLACPAGYRLAGTLAGEAGSGIPGAELEIFGDRGDGCSVFTGRDGRFAVEGLEAGIWEVQISASPYRGLRRRVQVPGPDLRLVLPGPARLAGRVLLPEGRFPDAGDACLERIGDGYTPILSTEIDSTGRFRLEAPPGSYLLRVDLGELGQAARPVTLQPGRTVAIEVPLAPCGRIEGAVVFGSGHPPPHGEVIAIHAGGTSRTRVEDSGGALRFELECVPERTATLFYCDDDGGHAALLAGLPVEAGRTRSVMLTPQAARGLYGLTTFRGLPLARVEVAAACLESGRVERAISDASGFYFLPVAEDGAYDLSLAGMSPEGGYRIRQGPRGLQIRSIDRADLDLAVADLRGRILSHGQPVPGARLEAAPAMHDIWDARGAISDDEGRYEIGLPGPGEWWIHVLREGDAAPLEIPIEIPAGAGEAALDIDLP